MPEQLFLPGIDPPPPLPPRPRRQARRTEPLPHSLFFAVFPDNEDAASLAAQGALMDTRHDLKATRIEARRLHVTLHDLGNFAAVPLDQVALALQAAATLAPTSFEVVFDEAMTYASSGALVLCGSDTGGGSSELGELAQFRQQLGEALADAGFKPQRAFTPHMTLAYTRRKIERHAIAPVRWTAGTFALIDSHRGQGVHEVLGRWPA